MKVLIVEIASTSYLVLRLLGVMILLFCTIAEIVLIALVAGTSGIKNIVFLTNNYRRMNF